MPLADTIHVKISSEAAEAVSLTPVVAREMPVAELMELVAAAANADPARMIDLLKRGSLVSGASRFRWQPLVCSLDDVTSALRLLPKSEPSRPFAPARCVRVALIAGARRWHLTRDAASSQRALQRLLRRPSCWSLWLSTLPAPAYVAYSHKERADLYRLDLDDAARQALLNAADLLPYPPLIAELRAARVTTLEWFVER